MAQMTVRSIARAGVVAGLLTLGAGLAFTYGSAFAVGDWWSAPQPWIGIGLTLLTVGLALVGAFGLLLVFVEPLGWWRLLALPAALYVAAIWFFYVVAGVPTTGGGGRARDVPTILYSVPDWLVITVIATLAILLPFAGRPLSRAAGALFGTREPSTDRPHASRSKAR